MIGRRSVVSLCVLCWLALSAVGAQSASAAFTGTTAFTCKEVTAKAGTAGFSDAHCKSAVGTNAKFEHIALANDATTELKGTNVKTGAEASVTTLNTTVAGIALELSAGIVEANGEMHNHLSGEEHQAIGSGTLTYSEVKVPKPSGEKGEKCIVRTDVLPGKTEGTTGIVDTEGLSASTAGIGDKIKVAPTAGEKEPFARFWIVDNPANPEVCPATLAPKTWTVVGNVTSSKIEGATAIFTKADTEAQKSLRFGGPEGPLVGISSTFTYSARANGAETYKALSSTTTLSRGTTAFTCKEVASGAQFKDAHCKGFGSGAGFIHEAVANDTTTELKSTNIETGATKSPFNMEATVGGTELELSATTVEGTGEMHNHFEGEEHQATGTGTLIYKEVQMPKPSGAGGPKCVVKTDDGTGIPGVEGVIDTEALKGTTASQGDGLRIEANEGEVFARFWIVQNPKNEDKCPAELVNTWTVVGSVVSTTLEGATVNFTRTNTTAQKTLRLEGPEGPIVGIEGLLTFSARASKEDPYKPLAVTTTP